MNRTALSSQVGQDQPGYRIAKMLHCPGFHFAQLDNGKAEVATTSPKLALILVGLPVVLGVTQDCQADNISWMFVEDR